jgi:hypothetical protein
MPSILSGGEHSSAEEVISFCDMLLVLIETLPESERERLWEVWEADTIALSPSCTTPEQAAGFASAVWGLHRVEASSSGHESLTTLQAVGELVASPVTSAESEALLVLSLVARWRWRMCEKVRDPRRPEELLRLPKL